MEEEQEKELDDYSDVEDFLDSLSEEEFKKYSAEIIISNDNIVENCLEAISNANLNSSNTALMVKGSVKNTLFLILPEAKNISKENKKTLKDIQFLKEDYENEGKEINSSVENVKKNYSELNKYTSDLLDYIKNLYAHLSKSKKEMFCPLINKKKGLDNVDESKISKKEKQNFINKKNEFNTNFEKYDKKLSDILKSMKSVYEIIDKKLQLFTGSIESMVAPVNALIDYVNEIFNEFEENSGRIITIIKNNNISSEDNKKIMSTLEKIKGYNLSIIELLKEKENFLENKNKDLNSKIKECQNELNKDKKITKETTNSLKQFNKDIKDLIRQINDIRSLFSLDEIQSEVLEVSGIKLEDFENKIIEGINGIIQINKKNIVELSKLRKLLSKKQNNEISDEMQKEKQLFEEINNRQFDLLKGNKALFNPENENLDLIEKKGKLNFLPEEEITKEKNKVQLLEDMNFMGIIMKKKILEEKKTNPEKFFTTEEIIKQKDNDLFSLEILSKSLENIGMVTAIEKEDEENKNENQKTAQNLLQFLIYGISNKAKYNLHFNFGEKKNKEILNDKKERKKFHDKLRKKLSEEYNINEEDIIITFPRKGSYQVTVIFKSQDFTLDKQNLIKKFQKYKDELSKLKDIEKGIMLDGCKLRTSMLDYRGNNKDGGWAGKGEKRGGEDYIPPIGWTGYGLKVLDVYNDNTWIGMKNLKGEWCVAYHGVGRQENSENVGKIAGNIFKGGFKASAAGKCTNDNDIRHPGKKCGLGVYCTPDIEYAEGYAGKIKLNKEEYKCVLMLRVNPEKIRQSLSYPKEYILEPSAEEIRPYRILLKKIN